MDTSTGSSLRREIAQEAARDLIQDSRVQAVILVGSVARAMHSEDSDIDLAVFTDAAPGSFIQTRRMAGALVEVDVFSSRKTPTGGATPLLSLQDLRDAGRFTAGIVLHSRWKLLKQAQTAWAKALLHPHETSRLLGLSASYLDPRRLVPESAGDQVWMLQGAAGALAVLDLSLQPFRFQKPKWVMRDLGDSSSPLLKPLRRLYFGSAIGRGGAQAVLEAVRKRLLAGFELAGFPPLVVTDEMDHGYFYIYRTFADALSLLADGDDDGSVYAGVCSLRLLNARMQETTPKKVENDAIDGWRRESLTALGLGRLTENAREAITGELLRCGRRLESEYRRRYLRRQSFEVVEEGAWRLGAAGANSSVRPHRPGIPDKLRISKRTGRPEC